MTCYKATDNLPFMLCDMIGCRYAYMCLRHQMWKHGDTEGTNMLGADPRKDNGHCHLFVPTPLDYKEITER